MAIYFYLLLRKLPSAICTISEHHYGIPLTIFENNFLKKVGTFQKVYAKFLYNIRKLSYLCIKKKNDTRPCEKTARRSKIFSSAEEIKLLGGAI